LGFFFRWFFGRRSSVYWNTLSYFVSKVACKHARFLEHVIKSVHLCTVDHLHACMSTLKLKSFYLPAVRT
jgi:hypothetical protein